MNVYERIESVPLSSRAPATARRLVRSLLEHRRADGRPVTEDDAARVALVASELVADAAEHGSEAATIDVDVTDDAVMRVEVFDGPRRRWIVAADDADEVSARRARLVRGLSDRCSSHALGDGHFARCEIHTRRRPHEQVFSHIGLVNAAWATSEAEGAAGAEGAATR